MARHDLVSLLLLFGTVWNSLSVDESSSQPLLSKEKSAVFLSPKIVLGPGSVDNKYYYNIDFPRGHIAIKEFNAEVVDESGNPVSLHETYLLHWMILRYYAPKEQTEDNGEASKIIGVRNSGLCSSLGQYFGLGSETRRTKTYVPEPYGIEVGDPKSIPDGHEERWVANVHAIDTRGVEVEDRLGCIECRCDLYNVTKDEQGQRLPPGYSGGLSCCYDKTQCKVKQGFHRNRNLYVRYTVKWVDWEETIVPVKIYIFDVTDTWETGKDSEACQVEYEVAACGKTGVESNGCIDNKKTSMVMPDGGYVIYGVAHQHTGGIGGALYGEDGRIICSSIPIYGKGKEVGNEDGYIVGMSSCYPEPGSVRISDGETLVLESNYSSTQMHTGVMGLFYLLVADQYSKPAHMPIHMQHKGSNCSSDYCRCQRWLSLEEEEKRKRLWTSKNISVYLGPKSRFML